MYNLLTSAFIWSNLAFALSVSSVFDDSSVEAELSEVGVESGVV